MSISGKTLAWRPLPPWSRLPVFASWDQAKKAAGVEAWCDNSSKYLYCWPSQQALLKKYAKTAKHTGGCQQSQAIMPGSTFPRASRRVAAPAANAGWAWLTGAMLASLAIPTQILKATLALRVWSN